MQKSGERRLEIFLPLKMIETLIRKNSYTFNLNNSFMEKINLEEMKDLGFELCDQ